MANVAKPQDTPLVFVHATVIEPLTSSVSTDRAVVIRAGRIVAIRSSDSIDVVDPVHVINAIGKFLIPGLWDMHVHTAMVDWAPGGQDVTLPLFIANGVTGVRDMGGEIPLLFAWREQIEAGTIVGPRMVVAGRMLDGYLPDGKTMPGPSAIPVTSPADAVAAVRSLAAQHVDFIKVLTEVPHDAYLAAAAEAHRLGLPFVGHVPTRVRLSEAIDAGQKSVEHLTGLFEGCSNREDQFIAGQGSMQLALGSYDSARCDALIQKLAQAQVWQCPTLAWLHGANFLDQLDQDHQPLARYVPQSWRSGVWRQFTGDILAALHADPLGRRQEYWHRILTMVAALHRAGVPLLAGTDTPLGVFIVPGFSLHDELAEFVEAGLAPMEALQTATSNPARFFGRTDIGTIAPGAHADLVLLDANPVTDIHNTTRIEAVVANGRLFDRAGLARLLHDIQVAATLPAACRGATAPRSCEPGKPAAPAPSAP